MSRDIPCLLDECGGSFLIIFLVHRFLATNAKWAGNALGNAAYHADIIAYTAASFDQTAKEDDKLGHGLFTYAVVEALEGKGGIAARRQIATKELPTT
jgi:uncharacterized caspase-like protein